MKPKVMEYDIGKDAYGRPVTLRFGRTYDGREVWSIKSDAINQRDEGEHINSLSLVNLLAIAEVVQHAQKTAPPQQPREGGDG